MMIESEHNELVRLRKENHQQHVRLQEVRRALVAANGGEDAVPRNVSLLTLVDSLVQLKTRYFNAWEETRERLSVTKRALMDHDLAHEEVSQD